MAIQFILGRSGTGKTRYCIERIIEALADKADTAPLVLLVPEQATYQAELAILSDERIPGFNRLNILSFERLSFHLRGRFAGGRQVSRIGQEMIVGSILDKIAEKLTVFAGSARQQGMISKITNLIIELHKYAKDVEDVRELIAELSENNQDSLLIRKFADIALIFEQYLDFIDSNHFVNPDYELTAAIESVRNAEFLKNAKLWVDGFADFTLQETNILAETLKVVSDAHIALCMDTDRVDLKTGHLYELDEVSLFRPTELTYYNLINEVIPKIHKLLLEPIVFKKKWRFADSVPLDYIEENLFSEKREIEKIDAGENVKVVSAINARSEVEFTARQIMTLVRERNCRFRDIAVVASDIQNYQHFIEAAFNDYGIPFFIDTPKPLQQHPLMELLVSSLNAAVNGFATKDIIAYLKSGLIDVSRDEVDLLENYCVAFGIDGSDWSVKNAWNFGNGKNNQFNQKEINAIRDKCIAPLIKLNGELLQEDIISERFAKIVFDFIDLLGVKEKLAQWQDKIDSHQQFYQSLDDILEQMQFVFGDKHFSVADITEMFFHSISQITLAFIPPKLDQVLIGSIERSRHPDLRAIFLIGASQKQFPASISRPSLLSDNDRITAEQTGFYLSDTTRNRLAGRQYLAYIAFTRPSQFLYITYPMIDEKGKNIQKSQFVSILERLFDNCQIKYAAETDSPDSILTAVELADYFCDRLGKDAADSDNKCQRLFAAMKDDTDFADTTELVNSSINYQNDAKLDSDFAKRYFCGDLNLSASRLKSFASCPYRYFAGYTLKLNERQTTKIEPMDMGNFYHNIMDALTKKLIKDSNNFATIDDNKLLVCLEDVLKETIAGDEFIKNFTKHSMHNAYIINSAEDVLADCVLTIARMSRAGKFRTIESEVGFGFESQKQNQLNLKFKIDNSKWVNLRGKIDRLDVAEIDGKKIAIVFDYKMSGKSFGWSEFYYGLDLQLPIYLLAIQSNGEYEAAGAFFMPIKVGIDEEGKNKYKAKGLFNAERFRMLDAETEKAYSPYYNFYISKDGQPFGRKNDSCMLEPSEFEKLLEHTLKKITQFSREISAGKIDIHPYRLGNSSPCTWCSYKPLCRFDWLSNDCNFLTSIKKDKVLEAIAGNE